jgi:hypothetical protein
MIGLEGVTAASDGDTVWVEGSITDEQASRLACLARLSW